jgi:nucleotide-binding universal stress UspA family protein
MRILVATDGSPCSEAAVEEVARRPWPEGSEVRVVSAADLSLTYAVEPWLVPRGYHASFKKAVVEQATAAVATAMERLRGAAGGRLAVSSELLEGSPKRAILEEAERWGADLIVVGSHGYGGLDRFLLGSVSEAVASHAKCSVEIVRSPGGRAH